MASPSHKWYNTVKEEIGMGLIIALVVVIIVGVIIDQKTQVQMKKNNFLKWQKQIEKLADSFELDVIRNNRIFESYKKLVQDNMAIDSSGYYFHQWVERNHYYALLAALRKIFFNVNNQKEYSLLKIITQLKDNGNTVTKQNYPKYFKYKFPETDIRYHVGINSATEGFFDSSGKLSQEKLKKDEEYLGKAKRKLKFINERVLHNQEKPESLLPSDKELEEIISRLREMLHQYRTFFACGLDVSWSIEGDLSWMEVFKEPWFKEDKI